MAKRTQKTRVYVNGIDVSNEVLRLNLPRGTGGNAQVEVTFLVSELDVLADGTLTICISTED